MPAVTTLHPVATKLAKEGTVMHRSPSSISSSQDTALSMAKLSAFYPFIFFLHANMTEIYFTVLG